MADYQKYNTLKQQNELLGKQLQYTKEDYSINKSQSLYKTEKVFELRKYNFILFIIYYICVILIALYFFFLNRTSFSFRLKIVLIIIFMGYPFIIDYIEQYVYFLYNYIYAFISGIAYT
jgi:lipopolysaccharide export LptBFGC system permease protein LptF